MFHLNPRPYIHTHTRTRTHTHTHHSWSPDGTYAVAVNATRGRNQMAAVINRNTLAKFCEYPESHRLYNSTAATSGMMDDGSDSDSDKEEGRGRIDSDSHHLISPTSSRKYFRHDIDFAGHRSPVTCAVRECDMTDSVT